METIKEVTSLELSKKLKELGVKQESLFYWFRNRPDMEYKIVYEISEPWITADSNYAYSAFTVTELGNMLSKATSENFVKAYVEVMDFSEQTMQRNIFLAQHLYNISTNPDIGASMLIYLLENKLYDITL